MTEFARTPDFDRNPRQESLLRELNDILARSEQEALGEHLAMPQLPILFIVGAPRSGTTLMLQWLASSGKFAYPTNLLSRFYAAPYVGAMIQQILTDPSFDYRGELGAAEHQINWTSNAGKTAGLLQPHEFFYYWRRFFPIDQASKLTDSQLARSDPRGFASGWAAIQKVFGMPVAAKGILLQYDIDRLAEWLPTSIFIHTYRDPFYNCQSLLQTRERVFGTRDAWFSVRPPEYDWLKDEEAYTQVAGQVLFTNERIQQQVEGLPTGRCLSVSYEAFCRNPRLVWAALSDVLAGSGQRLGEEYSGPRSFEPTNRVLCPQSETDAIRTALRHLADR